ncbi:uncharacterized protein LOC123882589 [Trifolium pratense]|uniref:uncharacterized protein LOC123882589 n=1 Tax=Trifolium pratense TaxID=57577 RepID=UPI001E69230C|nr:uncharacterized protein LOC123882589 [Trifolium pratense]
MELAQIHELDLEGLDSKQQMNIGSQRILVSDHINAYQYSSEKVDSYVIDMDSFSSSINKDIINANSRTTLQRNLSRKGSQRDRNVSGNVTLQDKDTVPTTCSPKASLLGPCKSTVVTVGSTQNSTNPPQQVHHQITVTAASNMRNNNTENKCITRRSTSYSWLLDPKKVLLAFATFSSVGTLLLIYLTLSISKHNGVEYGSDLQ